MRHHNAKLQWQHAATVRLERQSWRPLAPLLAGLLDALAQGWQRRDVVESDDDQAATGCSTSYAWSTGTRNPSWAAMKAIWRHDEASGPRCHLCGSPLAASSLWRMLSRRGVARICFARQVDYEGLCRAGAVDALLESAMAKSAGPTAWTLSFGASCAARQAPLSVDAAWQWFAQGQWDAHPRKSGTFRAASADGSVAKLVVVQLSEDAVPQCRERAHVAWWWNREVAPGAVLPRSAVAIKEEP